MTFPYNIPSQYRPKGRQMRISPYMLVKESGKAKGGRGQWYLMGVLEVTVNQVLLDELVLLGFAGGS
jgi:hypothetical protein